MDTLEHAQAEALLTALLISLSGADARYSLKPLLLSERQLLITLRAHHAGLAKITRPDLMLSGAFGGAGGAS